MTDLRTARLTLGMAWGLNRPLHMSELGRLLRLKGNDPGQSVRDWERRPETMTGPASVAIELMLAGGKPQHFAACLRRSTTP